MVKVIVADKISERGVQLPLARQVPRLDKAIHEGRWEKSSAAGTEVRGKTLGLIGLGRIGSEVAVRAEAFDMRVLAYDPFISEAAAREMSVELVPLDQLLAESDFVSLHTALDRKSTRLNSSHGYISYAVFCLKKKKKKK